MDFFFHRIYFSFNSCGKDETLETYFYRVSFPKNKGMIYKKIRDKIDRLECREYSAETDIGRHELPISKGTYLTLVSMLTSLHWHILFPNLNSTGEHIYKALLVSLTLQAGPKHTSRCWTSRTFRTTTITMLFFYNRVLLAAIAAFALLQVTFAVPVPNLWVPSILLYELRLEFSEIWPLTRL